MFTRFSFDKKESKFNNYRGKFRGAAHSKCNLNYKVPKDIPIIIKDELNCIGDNMEKHITLSLFLYELRKNMIMVKQLHTN